jgi:hypothetical protein
MPDPLTPAQARFKELLTLVHAQLKPLGFKKRGQNFYIGGGGNVGLINVQKSQFGSKDDIQFTINVAAWSRRLEDAFPSGGKTADVPTEPACQWRRRIGDWTRDQRFDVWWHVTEATDVKQLIEEIAPLIEQHAVPFLRTHLSDEDLRDHLARSHEGVGSPIRALLFLAELLSQIGPREDLPDVLVRLRKEAATSTWPTLSYEIERIEADVRGS